MKHSIPVFDLGIEGEIMAHAIEACVHCGFCLPACPTYQELFEGLCCLNWRYGRVRAGVA